MSTNDAPPSANALFVKLNSTLRVADIALFKQTVDASLDAAPGARLVCDASTVEFIDAAALQWLTALAQVCAGAREFVIDAPSAAFKSAATLSGYATALGLDN